MKSHYSIWRSDYAVAAGIFLAVALTRAPVFFRSVMDWDESLYFLMAAQWRDGHLPYTTIWDNKPIGIYAIFALFQWAFGAQVAAMRIASILFVNMAAFAVYRITLVFTADRAAALCAAAAYCLCSLSNDGLAANTEPFMAAFTALAVLAAAAGPPDWRGAALAGLCMGAAFMIKYVALFEDPAILFLLLSRVPRRAMAPMAFAMLAAAAVPLAVVVLLYWHEGQLPLWWEDSVAANFRRAGKSLSPAALSYIWQLEFLRWGPLYLGGAVMLASALSAARRLPAPATASSGNARTIHFFIAAWLLGGSLGVVAAKSFFDHYFLQLLPVLCVTFGWLLHRAGPRVGSPGRVLLLLVGISLPAFAGATALRDAARPVLGPDYSLHPDVPARIAADLAAPLAAAPGGFVYVFDDQPIIYGLLGQAPPTKFILPSVLTTVFLAKVAGVDAPAEVTGILDRRPLFIIRRAQPADSTAVNPAIYATVAAALAAHYVLWRSYPGSNVYRLVPFK